MRFKKIIKLFKSGNVSVCGLRGRGKDILIGNVIARRKKKYVSNLNYSNDDKFTRLDFKVLDINNNYNNFISNVINEYNYPYEEKADIYISDAQIYFPAQYCNKLNNEYEGIISFQALSRQIAKCNVHFNTQNLNRMWDKFREQSDIYIRCRRCIVLFGIVFQQITLYDKYESCLNRINPCRISVPIFGDKVAKMNAKLYLDNFYNQHGSVKNKILIYKNRSKHDTYYFKWLLSKQAPKNKKKFKFKKMIINFFKKKEVKK